MKDRSGMSLIEIVVALMIMSLGAVGFSATLSQMHRQAMLAEMDADRQIAKTYVVERLRGVPYSTVADSAQDIGRYSLNWSVTDTAGVKEVELVTVGPRFEQGQGPAVAYTDTLLFTVAPK